MINQEARAYNALNILVTLAPHGKLITYGNLAKELGLHARAARYFLAPIQDHCKENKLPPLTILVVNKQTKVPGKGFTAWSHDDLMGGRAKVMKYEWAKEPNPFAYAAHGTTKVELVNQMRELSREEYDIQKALGTLKEYEVTIQEIGVSEHTVQCGTSIKAANLVDALHKAWEDRKGSQIQTAHGTLKKYEVTVQEISDSQHTDKCKIQIRAANPVNALYKAWKKKRKQEQSLPRPAGEDKPHPPGPGVPLTGIGFWTAHWWFTWCCRERSKGGLGKGDRVRRPEASAVDQTSPRKHFGLARGNLSWVVKRIIFVRRCRVPID